MIQVYKYCPSNYFASNCYIVKSGDDYLVIDPSVDYNIVIKDHKEAEGHIKYILLTHAHFDHIAKINTWLDSCDKVIVGQGDGVALADSYRNCYLQFLGIDDGYFGEYTEVEDGTIIPFGYDSVTVISCPGHTVGGVSYRIGGCLFTGDTVFEKGGYGRCDLPGGDIEVLEKTLFKLFSTEKDEIFYPGHGEQTTLSDTLKYFM